MMLVMSCKMSFPFHFIFFHFLSIFLLSGECLVDQLYIIISINFVGSRNRSTLLENAGSNKFSLLIVKRAIE